MPELFADYTLRIVALGTSLIGIVAGALGTFAVQRRQSLVGDAISHAALPGVALAFLLTLSRHPLVLLTGAVLAGWLGMVLVMQITRRSRIKTDAALGIILACFFGLGIVLLSVIQGLPTSKKAGLETYLFGSAATMLREDVLVISSLAAVVLLLVAICWKEFKLLSFDPEFMAVQGWPVRRLDLLLTSLIVVAIAIGLQAVGVVLMSALLIAPAAAARQWSDRLPVVLLVAAVIGGLGGVCGALLSSSLSWSTGPAVVLIVSAAALLSLFLAPQRGMLWTWLRHRHQHRQVRVSAVLTGIYRLVVDDPDPFRAHAINALDAVGLHAAQRTMPELERQGWVKRAGRLWQLTEAGLARAQRLQREGGEL